MLTNRSIATIDSPEFIDIQPYNPLISQCNIKVLYLGRNRNNSYIDKNTAIQMANSLPGTPIVGAWRKDIEDYGDHGHVITIEDGEIKFACKTVPYGFVAPDARVWFQKFLDTDEFGNETEREYMMTTGYLWTGQYEEAVKAIQEGQPQSMELDEETLDGHWANDAKTGMDFFIINDAIFSKLCILGDDVEPCFEGASVTGVESNYTDGAEFTHTLYTMIKELQDMLGKEGGLTMPEKPEDFVEEAVETEFVETNSEQVDTIVETTVSEPALEPEVEPAAEPVVEEAPVVETELPAESEDFVAKKEEDAPSNDTEPADDDKDDVDEDQTEAERKKRECALEEEDKPASAVDHALEDENAKLRAELESLREFKRSIENKEKDALIAKYHMLSDEDKASVIEHKEEYSLEQIDEKLALIYVRKNVDFSTVDGQQEENTEVTESLLSFSLGDSNEDAEVVSDEIQAAFRAMNY